MSNLSGCSVSTFRLEAMKLVNQGEEKTKSQIPAQVWVGTKRPRSEKIDPIRPHKKAPGKKPAGGLWTSNLTERTDDGVLSPWISKMKRDSWSLREDPKAWILYPKEDLNILTITSKEQLKSWYAKKFDLLGRVKYRIKWNEIFQQYDAFRVTSDAYHEDDLWLSGEENIPTWAVPSTLWDGWHFEAIEYIGPVEYK